MLSNLGLVSEANLGKSEYTELHKLIYDVQVHKYTSQRNCTTNCINTIQGFLVYGLFL